MRVTVKALGRNPSPHVDKAADGERVVITKNGDPHAAIVSVEDLNRLAELEVEISSGDPDKVEL